MNPFLSVLLFFVSFLFSPYGQGEEPRTVEYLPQSCVEIPEGKEVSECSCDLAPPPEFREPERESSDGSIVRTSYPRRIAIGVGSHQDSAERDARETCIAAVREALIGSGMSVAEVDQYNTASHILDCRPYVCKEK